MSERQEELLNLLERWRGLTPQERESCAAKLRTDRPELLQALEQHMRFERFLELEGAAAQDEAPILSTGPPEEVVNQAPLGCPSIPGYEIVARLAQGGMGVVYKARCKSTGQVVAIKLILPGREFDPSAIRRFQREGRIVADLDHPNIVPIVKVGQIVPEDPSSCHFICMHYLEGGTLFDRRKGYTDDFHKSARLLQTIAEAVQYLHENNIRHRDLKPSNILFDSAGTPFVSDFGIAKLLGEEGTTTPPGWFFGTAPYASPEQVWGHWPLPPESDVYSLGAILYWLLTGRPPFVNPNPQALKDDIRSKTPARKPSDFKTDVPSDLDAICMDCLAKDFNHRYDSAKALADDLALYLKGKRPQGARPRSPRNLKVIVGNVVLEVRRIIGGDGQTRYRYPDGVVGTSSPVRFAPPEDVQEGAAAVVEQRRANAQARNAPFENRDMVRIDGFDHGLSDDEREAPYPLRLFTSVTDYFTMQATNATLDRRLPSGLTLREKYTGDPDEFHNSPLANPLCVNLSLVTSDQYIYVVKRGRRVGMNPGGWAPAVSGTGNPQLDCAGGKYDPFRTAIREANQEILGSYTPAPEEITFFGLARTLGFYFPFLFGELRVRLTARQLESQQPPDRYEIHGLVGHPFTVEDVTAWVRELYAEKDEDDQPTSRAHTTIFSLLQSLYYEFPDEWQRVIELLS